MANYAVSWIKEAWAGSPEKLEVARILAVDWFLDRKPYPLESLAKVLMIFLFLFHLWPDLDNQSDYLSYQPDPLC
jgi:hypothetical protein